MIIYDHVSHLLQALRGSNQTHRKHQANKKMTKHPKAEEIFDFHPSHSHLQHPGAEQLWWFYCVRLNAGSGSGRCAVHGSPDRRMDPGLRPHALPPCPEPLLLLCGRAGTAMGLPTDSAFWCSL